MMRNPLQPVSTLLSRIILVMLILGLIISLAVPIIAKHEVKKWLLANGAETVRLESLYINIWSGHIQIKSLSARAPDKPELKITDFTTHINYFQLLRQRLNLDLIHLGTSQIPIEQLGDQLFVGPILIPTGSDDEAAAEADTAESSWTWGWGLEEILLNQVEITHQIDDQPQNRLYISDAGLKTLQNWLPNQQSHFELHGSINDSTFNLDTTGNPLADDAKGTITLELDSLQLSPLVGLWTPDLTGVLDSNLSFDVTANADGFNIQQQGDISLSELSAQDDGTRIESSKIAWSGKINTNLDRQLTLLSNLVDGKFSVTGLSVTQPDLSISSQELSWEGSNKLLQDAATKAYTADTTANLNLTALKLALADLNISSDTIIWQGNNQASLDSEFSLQQQVAEGSLALTGLALSQPDLSVKTQAINWDGTVQFATASETEKANLDVNSGIEVTQLAVTLPEVGIKEKQLTWKGQVQTDIEQQLSVTGDLTTQELITTLQNMHIVTQNNAIKLAATIDLEKQLPQQIDARYSNQLFKLQDAKGGDLAAINKTLIENINIDSAQTRTVEGLKLTEIVLADAKETFLSIAGVRIDKTVNTDQRTHIHTINIDQPNIDILLDETQQPRALNNWLARLQGTDGQQPQAAAEQDPAQQPEASTDSEPSHELAIDQITVGKPALIKLVDNSAGYLNANVIIDTLTLAGIDSASPQPSPFELDASVNRFAKVKMKGAYNLLGDVADGNWDGSIKNIELPKLSPYMNGYSGYQFQNGQFSLTTNGSLDKGFVKSENLIEIHNLQITEGDSEKASAFNKKMGVPLPMALSLITDSDENVELDIPVEGSIDDPNFGVQSVINIVMKKIITEGAVGYLAATLQPYGALISIGRMVHSSTNSIELAPVAFAPGDDDLDDTAKDYLKKINELLISKQNIRLNVCGFVTSSDAQELKPGYESIDADLNAKLIQLARDRADNVKEALIDGEKIEQARLFSCVPEIDETPDAQPRVSLGF